MLIWPPWESYRRGAGQDTQNMILITIGSGIGAGIIIDGALLPRLKVLGEIGNFIPGREFLGKNYQDFGALETVASGIEIVERACASQQSEGETSGEICLTVKTVSNSSPPRSGLGRVRHR